MLKPFKNQNQILNHCTGAVVITHHENKLTMASIMVFIVVAEVSLFVFAAAFCCWGERLATFGGDVALVEELEVGTAVVEASAEDSVVASAVDAIEFVLLITSVAVGSEGIMIANVWKDVASVALLSVSFSSDSVSLEFVSSATILVLVELFSADLIVVAASVAAETVTSAASSLSSSVTVGAVVAREITTAVLVKWIAVAMEVEVVPVASILGAGGKLVVCGLEEDDVKMGVVVGSALVVFGRIGVVVGRALVVSGCIGVVIPAEVVAEVVPSEVVAEVVLTDVVIEVVPADVVIEVVPNDVVAEVVAKLGSVGSDSPSYSSSSSSSSYASLSTSLSSEGVAEVMAEVVAEVVPAEVVIEVVTEVVPGEVVADVVKVG